ncbi:thioredoxin [Salibacterium salarium]|uniref:Thioredoxin n=1 Tax=Salibacterium salarium TaxID=284579 RepID=A0A3R9P5T2_9BACI|nr:thioredoxin family protein [Salibacterium salarium]RSL33413.1 thioredoxin [Salibacterium salarium]
MNEIDRQEIEELKQRDTIGIFFYTPLCGTCKVAQQMTEHVEKIYGNSIFYKANINQMPDIAEREKIESVPCLKLFKKGQVIQTIYAFHSVPALLKRLHPHLQQFVHD